MTKKQGYQPIKNTNIPKACPPNTGSYVQNPLELTGKLYTEVASSDFVKADSGKLQWSLLPFEELKDVVKVLMLGAKKYSPDNWKKCNDVTRYKDALMRHVVSYISGDREDEESGLSHLAHAICNCLFLMWFDNTKEKEEK